MKAPRKREPKNGRPCKSQREKTENTDFMALTIKKPRLLFDEKWRVPVIEKKYHWEEERKNNAPRNCTA